MEPASWDELYEQLTGNRVHRKGPGTWACLCPFHRDIVPSLNIWDDDGHCYCFGCQKGWSYEQFAALFNADTQNHPRPLPTIRREKSIEPIDLGYVLGHHLDLLSDMPIAKRVVKKLIEERGLTHETIRQQHLGLAIMLEDGKNVARCVIPYWGWLHQSIESNFSKYNVLHLMGYNSTQKSKVKPLLWDRESVLPYIPFPPMAEKNGHCWITEGELDALVLHQAGFWSVSNCFGVGNAPKVWKTGKFRHLIECAQIITICFDNDDAGRTSARAVADNLIGHPNVNIIVWPESFPKGYDVSDWVVKDERDPHELYDLLVKSEVEEVAA